MKSRHIARGIVGALSLVGVMGLVGCGAQGYEEGAAGEGEIGSTSLALSRNASPSTLTSGFERRLAASCVIVDSVTSTRNFIYAGGSTASASLTPSNKIFKSTNGTAYTDLFVADNNDVLGTARYNMTAVVSDDETKCAFLGGATAAGSPSAAVDIVSVASGVFTVTHGTSLSIARELPRASICKTSGNVEKFVVVGGLNSSGDGIDDIEVSVDLAANGTWAQHTSGTADLNDPRGNFSLVRDGSNYRYVVAGGFTGSGNRLDSIEAIVMNSSCVPTVTSVTGAVSSVKLGNAVEGNEGFLKSTVDSDTSVFVFAAGRTGTAAANLATATSEITIEWSAFASSSKAGSPPAITGTNRPMLAIANGTPLLISGSNGSESAGLTIVQEYNGTNWTTVTPINLTQAHYTGVAGVLSGVVYVPTGNVPGTGLSTTIEEVTP